MDASKYRVGYFPVEKKYNKWVEKDHIVTPPVWCSVDMRDGNQSLVIPMSLEEKLEYFQMLLIQSSLLYFHLFLMELQHFQHPHHSL